MNGRGCIPTNFKKKKKKSVINEESPKAQSPAVNCGSFATPRAPALETPRSVKGKIWMPP